MFVFFPINICSLFCYDLCNSVYYRGVLNYDMLYMCVIIYTHFILSGWWPLGVIIDWWQPCLFDDHWVLLMTTRCYWWPGCDWWLLGVTDDHWVWLMTTTCDWWPPGVTNNCQVWQVIWCDWSPGVTNNCKVWQVIWYEISPGVTNNCQVW